MRTVKLLWAAQIDDGCGRPWHQIWGGVTRTGGVAAVQDAVARLLPRARLQPADVTEILKPSGFKRSVSHQRKDRSCPLFRREQHVKPSTWIVRRSTWIVRRSLSVGAAPSSRTRDAQEAG
jgi:hypothetical protein